MSTSAIRRLTIEANTKGVDQATQSLTALGRASTSLKQSTDSLAVSTDNSARHQLSAARSYDAMKKSVDEVYRAQTLQQKAQLANEAALNQGLIGANEYAKTAAQIAAKFTTSTRAGNDNAKAIGLNAHEMKNLGFQMNDVATMLASGSSPFQVLATQGGQVYQILAGANGGITGALKDLAGRFAGFLGPIGLVTLGFTAIAAAGYGIFSMSRREAPTLEKTLEEQARLLGLVKDAYGNAASQAGKFYQESKAVITLQTELNINNLQQALRDQTKKMQLGLGSSSISFDPLGNALGGNFESEWNSKFAAFRQPIEALQQQMRDGVPDVTRFREEIAKIAAVDPRFKQLASELLDMSQAAETTAEKLKLQERAMRLLQGTATPEDRAGLGLAKAQVSEYAQIIQRTRDRIEELKLEATTAGQTAGAVEAMRLQHEAELAAKRSGVQVNQQVLDQLKSEMQLRMRDVAVLRSDIAFERSQIGLTDSEQAANTRIRSIYGPDSNTPQAEFYKQQLRINDALRMSSDLGRDAFKGFAQDILASKNATEALSGALNKVASKLLDMATDSLWSSAFGGRGGGLGSLFSGMFGAGSGPTSLGGPNGPTPLFATGGFTGAGGKFEPAGIVHRGEYVFSMDSVNRLGRNYLDRLHRAGARGYAAGGFVGAPTSGDTGGATSTTFAPVYNIDARGADEGVEQRIEKVLERHAAAINRTAAHVNRGTRFPVMGV